MKTILSITLTVSLFTIKAQSYRERTIEPFNKIQISGSVKTYYTHSDTLSLKITGDESEMDRVDTRVENGTLFITGKGKFENAVTVSVKNNKLNAVGCIGSTEFRTVNTLKSDSISFDVAGASFISAKLESNKVIATQSGASNISLSGNTNYLQSVVSGASVLKAYNLVSKNANVITTGASSARIYVTDKLNANASGASNIKVKGDVKDINAEATTASSITKVADNIAPSDKSNRGDTTIYKWNGRKVIVVKGEKLIIRKRLKNWSSEYNHWAGFSIGVNGLLTPDAGFTMEKPYSYLDLNYSRSINFQLNFLQRNFHIYKNHINLVTGFGIEWRRYMLDNHTTLNADSSFTWGTIDSTKTFKYNKNLFKSTMLQVPLLLDFNIGKSASKSFHFAVGVIGQFMINSKTKQKLENNGDNYTKINKDSYNMNVLNLKAHASIGYANFTVFGEYNVTPLFAKAKGPQVYPFVAGLRLVAF